MDTVTIGEGGELDWLGEGSAPVARIDAQHRSPLDPDNLLVGNSPGDLIEFAREDFPLSILPRRIDEGENIATGTLDRGGKIYSPNVFDFSGTFKPLDLAQALEELINDKDGGELLAFERKNFNSLGILVILDLGARFGVDRIRFYPRNTQVPSESTPFQNDFLRSFEMFTNDGLNLTREGTPIWEPLIAESDNKEAVVDVPLDPPRYVQSIRLRATSPINFEIDELEVFGRGLLSQARYISDIFDAGLPAVWGTLRWSEEILGDPNFSSLQIRTRTGTDTTPFVFTRKLQGKRDAEEIPFSLEDPTQEMVLAEYRNLFGGHAQVDDLGRQWEAGSVKDDLVNWSPYSTPFSAAAANGPGLPITSPSPRRYLQFQALFKSDDLEAARVLRSLSFELLTPPLADELVGEIFPREVEVSRATSFTFAVRAVMDTPGLLGFDTIRISTAIRVQDIEAVEITDASGQVVAAHEFLSIADTSDVDGFRIISVEDDRFVVGFPLVEEDGSLLRLRFRTAVLSFSTSFNAAVELSDEPGAAQPIVSGNAASLDDGDVAAFSGTTVLSWSVLKGRLLDAVSLAPNPFTPNGDQINDVLAVEYNVLALSVARPIEIAVYDLAGRRVRTLHDGPEQTGRYEDKSWDGRDEEGKIVPPGMYIVRIVVEGDSQQEEQSRAVAVVY